MLSPQEPLTRLCVNIFQEVLRNIHKAMILRLDSMDKKLDSVALQCDLLEEKVDAMSQHLISNGIKIEEVTDATNKGL